MAQQPGKPDLVFPDNGNFEFQHVDFPEETDKFLGLHYIFFAIEKIRLQVRMDMKRVRHADNIGVAIFKSRDDIPDTEKRTENAIVGQKKTGVCLVLRIYFQACFSSIKIVPFILAVYNSYAAFRESLQIFVRNRVTRADEYDIESRER